MQNLVLLHAFPPLTPYSSCQLPGYPLRVHIRCFGGEKEVAEARMKILPVFPKSPPLPPFLRVSKVLFIECHTAKDRIHAMRLRQRPISVHLRESAANGFSRALAF